MKLDQFLYMAEAEGVTSFVNTKQAKINKVIKDFVKYSKQGYDINSELLQEDIFNENDIDWTLSQKERDYIIREVERRW